MLQILKAYGISTPTEVIPTGIEPESFVSGDRAAFRKKYGIGQDQPVLLFVGRVAFEKNIEFLIKVLESVRKDLASVLFVIAGEGPARQSLKHEVIRLGLDGSTRFIGYLDRHKELNSCYCAADLFIFSSRTETQGLVLLEAMAQGVPVVSTAELGTRDVLREGLGAHIAQEDVADFAGKVITLLNDAPMRQELGDAGREYAQTWSASRQAQRMLAFYRAVPGFAVQSGDGNVNAISLANSEATQAEPQALVQ
jgi:glycosyltransferase involved in cell wall biosynthesis